MIAVHSGRVGDKSMQGICGEFTLLIFVHFSILKVLWQSMAIGKKF